MTLPDRPRHCSPPGKIGCSGTAAASAGARPHTRARLRRNALVSTSETIGASRRIGRLLTSTTNPHLQNSQWLQWYSDAVAVRSLAPNPAYTKAATNRGDADRRGRHPPPIFVHPRLRPTTPPRCAPSSPATLQQSPPRWRGRTIWKAESRRVAEWNSRVAPLSGYPHGAAQPADRDVAAITAFGLIPLALPIAGRAVFSLVPIGR